MLPSGASPGSPAVVAFLFTDVEGSTALLERFGADLTRALTEHHALIEQAVRGLGGRVFETVGDAAYAAFADPLDCARAAIAVQRAMLEHDWGDLGDVRLRAAVHLGSVERRGGHYVGPALFRAARILALGHGGQTLVSADMASAIASLMPPEMALQDLGRHRLKDLTATEHVHQLGAPGLPATFPPLRSVGPRLDSLPRPLSLFLGREQELEAIDAALRDARLVSLVGPGGCGKTRLAVEAGRRMAGRFLDGTAFVDLAAVREVDLVGASMAGALGVRAVGDEAPETAVARWIGDRDLLIVVDNLEQVIDGAPLLSRLLEATPNLRIMATSRERLRLRGERSLTVEPLPFAAVGSGSREDRAVEQRHAPSDRGSEPATPSTAAALYCDRAHLDPHAGEGADLPTIERLVALLDGLPLAIELAAARADVLTPAELLVRLERDPTDTGSGDRDLPARQRTLRATIAWSLDLLEPADLRLFARLGVFVGPWTTRSASAVCEGGDRRGILDGLEALTAKSLVRRSGSDPFGEPRFDFLATIREAAAERFRAMPDRAVVEDRHSAWSVALAETAEPELLGPASGPWLDTISDALPDLRLAVDRALAVGDGQAAGRIVGALGRFWWRTGRMREGRELGQRVLACALTDDVLVGARVRLATAESSQQLGRIDEAAPLIASAVEALEPLGPSRDLAVAFHDLGVIAAYGRQAEEAVAAFERSRRVWGVVGDPSGLAFTTQSIGLVHSVLLGDVVEADRWTAEAYAIARESADPYTRAECGSVRAETLLLLHRSSEAAAVLSASVADHLAAHLPDPLLAAQMVGQLGMLAADRGFEDDAARLHGWCVRRHGELVGRTAWLSMQWTPFESVLGQRLGPAIRDALMAEGAGLTADAAFELGTTILDRLRVEPTAELPGTSGTGISPGRPA